MNQTIRAPRRAYLVALALAVAVAVIAAGSAAGASPGHFGTPTEGTADDFTPAQTPLAMSSVPLSYILQLPGDPVAVTEANSKDAGSGALSDAQKQAQIDQLQAQQAPVIQAAQNLGATVTGSFQSVYNGIAVQIAAKDAWKLATLSGVSGVFRGKTYSFDNIHGIPMVGAPQAWDGVNGFHGEGMKIADLDTGIDYTHADFGGSGNPLDYQTALATDTLAPTTASFGPTAAKVKGGIDLVGDSYNAGSSNPALQIPQPDPNPLDCNGHGTHTAGTAAGFGVLANGSSYTGPYNATTVSGNSWNVGPGVAPLADIYAVRVFGCSGSVSDAVLIQAMDWSVQNHMDVINMSLGAPFGNANDPDSVAASNTAKDGVIVVSASGNNGNAPYITSSPAAGTNGIAVAASDPTQSFPAATLSLSTGVTRNAIDANGATITPGTYSLKVIYRAPNVISLGCSVADDQASGPIGPNTFIVVARGTCARVAKGIFGQQAGAAGVIMVNNSTAFPPFEGKITGDPDAAGPPLFGGFKYTVTIPFLGVQGGSSPSTSTAGTQLRAADGGTVTVAATTIANPGFATLASFSSFGPSADGSLKPEVTAPGVSIASAGMGTGSEASILSGTSMATPHTAGMALLVKQAHPSWKKVAYWKDAIVNTANPAGVAGYSTRGAGAGLIQAFQATHTQVVASGDKNGTSVVNFGAPTLVADMAVKKNIRLHNFGSTDATFNVADTVDQGMSHTVTFNNPTVTVPAGGDAVIEVTLNVCSTCAADPTTSFGDWFGAGHFDDVAGLVSLTPASGSDNSGIPLTVPYYAVPTSISQLKPDINTTKLAKNGTADASLVNNAGGGATGFADWFAWGGKDEVSGPTLGSADLTAAGVQSFPSSNFATFALTVNKPWTNAAMDEFDIYVDVNNDGTADYDVASVDDGALLTGTSNGEAVVAVITLATGRASIHYLTGAYWNGTTMELPVDFSQLCVAGQPCISATTPISYQVYSFDRNGGADTFASASTYNLFKPVFSNSFEDVIAPGLYGTDTTTIDKTQWAATPQLGLLVLAQNNQGQGAKESYTFTVTPK